ncbi:TPA: 50S ribosomal protein L4 [Candidatus Gracilibacteria bacterium]|nr:50S ribosomal protein L4 [Candidatus Peregrinibacteria bacterium]HIQ56827.1 50S ribosomal protein L4 [Candidatus Gracilibacteria bacterium]HIQ57375.1 50S ribosomal protein L4 [Candidatus Gracilibacteria bacterium]
MKAVCYTQSGEKKSEVELPASLFIEEPNIELIYLAVVRQHANGRKNIAKVKTRAMVRGGGRKPFNQKGTGRARQGTIRAPQMRGGGVVFGPTGRENYSKAMPKKMRRKALFSALSLKASDNKVALLDTFSLKQPSTKAFLSFLSKIENNRKVLVVAAEKDFILEKSVSNISGVRLITANYLNTVDVMQSTLILFLEDGLKKAEDVFAL